jgi:uncharacterized protein DUF1761
MSDRINHLAVWVAAIVYYVFGAVWFGVLFGGVWTSLVGKTMPASPGVFAGSFVLGLILSYATAVALARHPEDQTVPQGISFALFMGIALYATQTANAMLYAGQPPLLWLIDTAYVVIGFAIIGAIVGGWKKRVSAPA